MLLFLTLISFVFFTLFCLCFCSDPFVRLNLIGCTVSCSDPEVVTLSECCNAVT